MQRSNPLRDPFANQNDFVDPSASSARQQGPADRANANANSNAPTRSLGLSLGLPRSRLGAKRDQSGTTASASDTYKADDAVRNTDSDALLSRLSALKLGYLPPEPFTQEFSTSSPCESLATSDRIGFRGSEATARRSPLINIGTFLRCTTIDAEVESFLMHRDGQKQIISIGAGSDSRYWRLMSNAILCKNLHHYVEIDFAENTSQKLSNILRSHTLRSYLDLNSTVHGVRLTDLMQNSQSALGQPQPDSESFGVLRSSKYSLLAADVRRLHPDIRAADRIDAERLLGSNSTGLRSDLPTLLIFECVLSYIAPEKADWLIRLLGQRFADVCAVSYDIALAGDTDHSSSPTVTSSVDSMEIAASIPPASVLPSRFGRVMLQNLEMRKLSLPGAKAYATIHAQGHRFTQAWSSSSNSQASQVEASGRSLFSIWSSLDAGQKSRLSRLEGLDEVEEIDMLLKHYCIVRARRIP